MDFVTGLPRTSGGYDSIWVIVDRLTKSAHFLPVKTTYGATQYAQLYVDEIIRLHGIPVSIVSDKRAQFTSRFWQKLQEMKGLGISSRRSCLLKVSPMKGIMRFGKKGKLNPRYIGPFEILERVGAVAYRLALPLDLLNIHPMFHVLMLRKYNPDPSHVIWYETIQLNNDLTYEEQPVAILDRQVKKLCSKEIALVKVLWRNHTSEEVTWEAKEEMRTKYPHLFNM
ncbi:PREDICTED: uncharacterized protein LOC108663597 [Theobroma cacao]|uniref:Uncharacterized protein LOC108663597 n=1 Tax=Theobroma cacao TaxID=3641 RepID=A0AB32X1N7_THECC|nr:PREDICTED: uncharacterized protein LOC108663597 [Theobroma cacao]